MSASLLALLDDITSVLDDVALLTKLAAKKTVGVLGDDLALNAQQVAGVRAARELPVVAAVAKGSLLNKAILVPLALAISAFAPWAVTPLLMLGGAYLCFEGFEKLAHRLTHSREEDAAAHEELVQHLDQSEAELLALEKQKIRGAIRTDFILSAEIIVIALGTVSGSDFITRVGVLATVAVAMTVGVYGLVAAIVKLDDLGLFLSRRGGVQHTIGCWLLRAAPWLMKGLAVAGTAAMFLVGGGILVHGVPALHHAIEAWTEDFAAAGLLAPLANAAVGLAAGGIILLVIAGGRRMFRREPAHARSA